MSSHAATTQTICRLIADNAAAMAPGLDPASISFDHQLENYGLNSIDRVEIILQTLGDLGLDIPLISFARSCSIAELASCIQGAGADPAGADR